MAPTNANIVKLVQNKGALERALLFHRRTLDVLQELHSQCIGCNIVIVGDKALYVNGTWDPMNGGTFVDVRLAQHYLSKVERCRKAQCFRKNHPNDRRWCVRKFYPNGKVELVEGLSSAAAKDMAYSFVIGWKNASKHKKKRSKKA